ncbi:hypothetical protein ALC57_14465 [Trachymyrmex cornetzi]|uniref:Uncharacterized protein n=1 Tax=Trachymyrmex cornetzi TaxID=471704 RepID=A0A195DKT6_9HYME|nr:hypothetical protein ALC57_14465 [Trachymyrmex cornetzi]
MPGTGKEESVFQIDTLLFDPSRFFVRALRELYRVSRRMTKISWNLVGAASHQLTCQYRRIIVKEDDIDILLIYW